MKLLTLNTHSLQEEHYSQKLTQFIDVIAKEQPDILALQEVNQTMDASPAPQELLTGLAPCPGSLPIRRDNHAARTALGLRKLGLSCSYTWISSKIGYDRYDEGLALVCLNRRIQAVDSFYISGCEDYHNWKTRRVLGVQVEGCEDWFYTVHMGWWQDEEEPFACQWERLSAALLPKTASSRVWLMGDFNSPAEGRGQGYDLVLKSGWTDTYEAAVEKDGGITVEGCIDGWRSYFAQGEIPDGMRIDYIWCSRPSPVRRSRVLFNGTVEPKVSDHFGVLIEF